MLRLYNTPCRELCLLEGLPTERFRNLTFEELNERGRDGTAGSPIDKPKTQKPKGRERAMTTFPKNISPPADYLTHGLREITTIFKNREKKRT